VEEEDAVSQCDIGDYIWSVLEKGKKWAAREGMDEQRTHLQRHAQVY
jgi:hypothetical protein